MKTQNVEMITEINGAIAGTQKYFLFLFPCSIEIASETETIQIFLYKSKKNQYFLGEN